MRPLDRSTRITSFILAALVGCSMASAQAGMRLPQQIIVIEPEEESDLPAPPNSGRSIEDLITALDAPSLPVRDEARLELTERRDITLSQLEAALDRKDLTPEQRIRLDAAAYKRFYKAPRAAMGISWNLDFPEIAGIIDTIEGFDAHRKLQPGDIFVAVGEQIISGAGSPQQALRWEIISRDPGDMLHVTVMRGKNLVDLDLELGSYRQLGNNTGALSDKDMAAAYRMRGERRGRVNTGPSFGLTRDDWDEARIEGDKRFNVQMQHMRTQGRGTLVAGGAPRRGPDDDREQFRQAAGRPRVTPMNMNNLGRLALPLDDPMERQTPRSATVGDEIRRLEARVERLRKQAEIPGVDEDLRRPLVVQGQVVREPRFTTAERLAAAERMLEALKARTGEPGEVADKPEADPKGDGGGK